MNILSPKIFLLLGFAISLISIILNAFVMASISSHLEAINSEYSELEEAFDKQVTQLTQIDLKFDVYRVMHYLALLTPTAKIPEAKEDAKEILQGFLIKFYAAANDISPVEVNKIAMDEAGELLSQLQVLMQSFQPTTGKKDQSQLSSVTEKLGKEEPPAKSELASKLREVGKYAEAETTSANGLELVYKLFPVMKSFTEQLNESIKRKESRMDELERERSSLERKLAYADYASISLQIVGLMFILALDIVREIADSDKQDS